MISVSCQSIARSEAEADAPASRTAGQIVVYTDWLWFREVQFTSVFVTVLQTQILLGVVTGAAFFLILHGNVTLARRLATREALVVADDLPGLPSPEILQPHLGRLTLPVSVTLALFAGWLGTGRWGLVLKALNPTPFGIRDPPFDQDVAFYVFRLPLWSSLYGWLMGVLVCLGSRRHRRVFLHPGHSGLPGGVSMSRRASGHLLVLAALLLLLKAAGYRLAMFDLLFSERGVAFGAGWLAARSERPRTSVRLSPRPLVQRQQGQPAPLALRPRLSVAHRVRDEGAIAGVIPESSSPSTKLGQLHSQLFGTFT